MPPLSARRWMGDAPSADRQRKNFLVRVMPLCQHRDDGKKIMNENDFIT